MNSPLKVVLSPESVAQFEAGSSIEQLIETSGHTKRGVIRALKRQGAKRKIPTGRKKGCVGTNKLVLPVSSLSRYEEGESSYALAQEMGVGVGAVLNALRRQGVTIRNGSEAHKLQDHTPLHQAWKKPGGPEDIAKRMSAGRQKVSLEDWQGFATPEWRKVYSSAKWRKWRTSVLARDQRICQLCGWQRGPGGGARELAAHHIYAKAQFPEKAWQVSNGITLCVPCHQTISGKEGEYVEHFVATITQS